MLLDKIYQKSSSHIKHETNIYSSEVRVKNKTNAIWSLQDWQKESP